LQQFQSVIIDVLGKPIEMALKGANQVSKLLGLGSIDVKGIMGDLTKFATDSTKKINETIQQLKPTNLQKQIDGGVSGWLTKQIFDPEAVKEEGEKTLEELSKNVMSIESEIAGGQLQLNEINNKASAKQAKDKKEADTSMTDYLNALEAERQANIKDAREKELQEAANKYDELTALADKAGQSTTEIDKKYIEQRTEINKRFDTLEKEERAKAEAEALEKMIAADAAAWEIEKTNRQARIDGMKEGRAKELEVIDLAYDSELLALNNQLDAKTLSEEEKTSLRADIAEEKKRLRGLR